MPATHKNRLVCTVSAVASAGLGAWTVSAAQSGYRTFAAGDDAKTFDVVAVEGTAWEVRTGCTYTHSGTTLSRGTLEDSSTGSAVTFTSACVLSVTLSAAKANLLEAAINPGFTFITNDGVTTQTPSSGVDTKIAAMLNTVVANPFAWWDTTNKKFQPTRAGKYWICASVQNSSDINNNNGVSTLRKNGSTLISGMLSGDQYAIMPVTAVIDLNGSTDYVELYNQIYTGTAWAASATTCYFQAIYLGP